MARPQKFNRDMVLDSAMQLFWQKGFTNTSIKDLTQVTQLQPGSIYAAFKSKRNLFLLSLDYYYENLFSAVNNILSSDAEPIQKIRQFFDFLLSQKDEDKELKSCLLVNTLIEVAPQDEEINKRVSQMFEKIEGLFFEVLSEAKNKGELQSGAVPSSVAKMLMSGIFGIQVYNRMQPDGQALRQIVNNLLSNIEKG